MDSTLTRQLEALQLDNARLKQFGLRGQQQQQQAQQPQPPRQPPPVQQQYLPQGRASQPPPAVPPQRYEPQRAAEEEHEPEYAEEELGEGGETTKSFGEMKIWTGTWNMGAVDPFLDPEMLGNPEKVEKMLSPFVPQGYDLYVLGVQEGISDKVFEAVEAWTGSFRVPLHTKIYKQEAQGAAAGSTGGSGGFVSSSGVAPGTTAAKSASSRRIGRAISVQSMLEDAGAGIKPEPVASTADMLDRVWGRGDGALLTPKFTGIAVFVAPVVAPYVRLLSVYKHSFGASEGSKGGVGVALGLYDVTIAFVNVHMASKRADMRRMQYSELVDRLGAKLGGRGFGLNEEFHHIVWMGDLNTHVTGVPAAEVVDMMKAGRQSELLLHHDELLLEKEQETCFYAYEEPLMGPRFLPTYKKVAHRGRINYREPDWPSRVYVTAFKEPFYKGGRLRERVPSWTDRIQYHSLPDRSGELLPEPLDPEHPDTSPHNYHAVNDVLDCSDHSPVFATFSLSIVAEELPPVSPLAGGGLGDFAATVEAAQGQLGYGRDTGPVGPDGQPIEDTGDLASPRGGATASSSFAGFGGGPGGLPPVLRDADFSALPPSLRPMVVVLRLGNILVERAGTTGLTGWGGSSMRAPRAVSVLFPLPYEDSNALPERAKIVRQGTVLSLGAARSESRDSLSAAVKTLVSRQSRLEGLHLLLKVSLDDNVKAQAVVCMRDGGFVGLGSHMNTFMLPLTQNGVPLKMNGKPVHVQFVMEMNAYERGGQQAVPMGINQPVKQRSKPQVSGLLAARRAAMMGLPLGAGFSESGAPRGQHPAAADFGGPEEEYEGQEDQAAGYGAYGKPIPGAGLGLGESSSDYSSEESTQGPGGSVHAGYTPAQQQQYGRPSQWAGPGGALPAAPPTQRRSPGATASAMGGSAPFRNTGPGGASFGASPAGAGRSGGPGATQHGRSFSATSGAVTPSGIPSQRSAGVGGAMPSPGSTPGALGASATGQDARQRAAMMMAAAKARAAAAAHHQQSQSQQLTGPQL